MAMQEIYRGWRSMMKNQYVFFIFKNLIICLFLHVPLGQDCILSYLYEFHLCSFLRIWTIHFLGSLSLFFELLKKIFIFTKIIIIIIIINCRVLHQTLISLFCFCTGILVSGFDFERINFDSSLGDKESQDYYQNLNLTLSHPNFLLKKKKKKKHSQQ